MTGGSERPLLGLDVDGVVALAEPPAVEARRCEVSAGGRWRRCIYLPSNAEAKVRTLSERYQIVWVSAWGHTAHTTLRPVLDLPEGPWNFLPVQFGKAAAFASWAGDRPWALVHDGVDDEVDPGLAQRVIRVDPHRGIADLETAQVEQALAAPHRIPGNPPMPT